MRQRNRKGSCGGRRRIEASLASGAVSLVATLACLVTVPELGGVGAIDLFALWLFSWLLCMPVAWYAVAREE